VLNYTVTVVKSGRLWRLKHDV